MKLLLCLCLWLVLGLVVRGSKEKAERDEMGSVADGASASTNYRSRPPWKGRKATCTGSKCDRSPPSPQEQEFISEAHRDNYQQKKQEDESMPYFRPNRRKLTSFVDDEDTLHLVTHEPVKLTYHEAQDWNLVKRLLHEKREEGGRFRRVLKAFVPDTSLIRTYHEMWGEGNEQPGMKKEPEKSGGTATAAISGEGGLFSHTARVFSGQGQ